MCVYVCIYVCIYTYRERDLYVYTNIFLKEEKNGFQNAIIL